MGVHDGWNAQLGIMNTDKNGTKVLLNTLSESSHCEWS